MILLPADDPRAVALQAAVDTGDLDGLRALLAAHPELATARFGDGAQSRTALHAVADWPGHRPDGPAMVAILVAAGADVDARFAGPHRETPLHWAASSDDVAVLDALVAAGADLEADGAVIAGGPPLEDARAFGQWRAARRLVELGARTTIHDEAALGLLGRLKRRLAAGVPREDLDPAFWNACHGGQRAAAELLLDAGADIDWLPPWERVRPLDAAARAAAADLAAWLRARGARSAD